MGASAEAFRAAFRAKNRRLQRPNCDLDVTDRVGEERDALPAPRTVPDADDLDLVFANSIDQYVRRDDHQLARILRNAGPPNIRKLGKAIGRTDERFKHLNAASGFLASI